MNKSNKFSSEVRERAVRMVQEQATYRAENAGCVAYEFSFGYVRLREHHSPDATPTPQPFAAEVNEILGDASTGFKEFHWRGGVHGQYGPVRAFKAAQISPSKRDENAPLRFCRARRCGRRPAFPDGRLVPVI